MNQHSTIKEGKNMQGVTVVDHPLVQHKLTLMRDKERSTKGFRQLLNEIGMLLCYEVTRDLPLESVDIETPLTGMQAPQLAGKKLVLAPPPMRATANSAVAAVDRLKERGAREMRFVCLLAAPEGIEKMRGAHPDVPIWTAAIDSHLDEHGYIVPGLGDAGDRMYGT